MQGGKGKNNGKNNGKNKCGAVANGDPGTCECAGGWLPRRAAS